MKEMVFNNFQKVWTRLIEAFLNFSKISCGPPFANHRVACCISPKFFKTCFYQSKVIVLMKEMFFDNFQKVAESLEWFGAPVHANLN
jgi:hypothetical protein